MKKIELYPHQEELAQEALIKLNAYGLVYLNLEMRVGKTLTALRTCELDGACRVLFVTTKKAMPDIKKQAAGLGVGYDLTVINYDSLHKVSGKFDIVIPDEAHCNGAFPKPSLRAKRLKELVGDAKVIYLSGTAHPETLSQLYNQFWLSSNGPWKEYKNFYAWAKDYVEIKQIRAAGGQLVNDYSRAIKEKVMADVDKYFIRYTMEDAGFAQSAVTCIHENVEVPASIHAFAEKLTRVRIHTFKDGDTVTCDTAVKLQMKLHQLFSGSIITDSGACKILHTSKAELIKRKYSDSKIAIFYKYIGEREILKIVFPNWTEDPEEFQRRDDLVFLGQLQSACRGVDLSTAKYLIFYNIDFSYERFEQASARSHNMKRTQPVTIVYMLAYLGIDGYIYSALMKKQDYNLQKFRKDYGIGIPRTSKNIAVPA